MYPTTSEPRSELTDPPSEVMWKFSPTWGNSTVPRANGARPSVPLFGTMTAGPPPMVVVVREALHTLATSGPRVLVADPDEVSRRLIVNAVRASARDVVEVGDALGALDTFRAMLHGDRESNFDVIVSDVRMPGFSGLDVLAALRAMHADRPGVIILTGARDDAMRRSARELGAVAILEKPVRAAEVVLALTKAVAMGQQQERPEVTKNSGQKGE